MRLIKKYKLLFVLPTLLLLGLILMSSIPPTNLLSYRWGADPVMRVANNSFPDGSIWRTGLEMGVNRWNGMGGNWLEFDLRYENYNSFSNSDGENNVAFVSAEAIDNNWARDAARFSGSERLESDIMFNVDIAWRPEVQDERIRRTDAPSFIQAGVIHEFGHSTGLDHETSELAQMAQGFSGGIWYGGCETYRHHPTPDDAQGARLQHPFPSTVERDAALMNFEMLGGNNTQVWRNNNTVTNVAPGGFVDVEYTVANPGNTGISFDLGVYISTNDFISRFDTYIGGFNYFIPANSDWERDKSFRIPSNMASGVYFIGAVVDIDDTLDENRECNNRLVFPGRWRVQ